jgi:hypothetical protein
LFKKKDLPKQSVLGGEKFRSAAELAIEVRKTGIKKRWAYLAAAKARGWPSKPESFSDWPSRVEPGYSEKESWEIFFGTFNEDRVDTDAESRLYRKMMAQREVRAAEIIARDFPGILENEQEVKSELYAFFPFTT